MRYMLAAGACWLVLAALLSACRPFEDATAEPPRTTQSAAVAKTVEGDVLDTAIKSPAARYGWLDNFNNGQAILQSLSDLNGQQMKDFDIATHRGKMVAFVAAAAPPGATNDLVVEGGYYLRVVNADGKDWRPHAAAWTVLVNGTILQVLPENKIVVVQVEKPEHWVVLDTF